MRSQWDKRKTAKQNLQALGIAYDVNIALPISKPEGKSGDEEEMMTIEEAKKLVQSTGTGAPPVRPDPLVVKWIDGDYMWQYSACSPHVLQHTTVHVVLMFYHTLQCM